MHRCMGQKMTRQRMMSCRKMLELYPKEMISRILRMMPAVSNTPTNKSQDSETSLAVLFSLCGRHCLFMREAL